MKLAHHTLNPTKIDQKEGKLYELLTELRVLVRNCKYGDIEESKLRSRIILETKDRQLQQKPINSYSNFDKVLEMFETRKQLEKEFNENRGTTTETRTHWH